MPRPTGPSVHVTMSPHNDGILASGFLRIHMSSQSRHRSMLTCTARSSRHAAARRLHGVLALSNANHPVSPPRTACTSLAAHLGPSPTTSETIARTLSTTSHVSLLAQQLAARPASPKKATRSWQGRGKPQFKQNFKPEERQWKILERLTCTITTCLNVLNLIVSLTSQQYRKDK